MPPFVKRRTPAVPGSIPDVLGMFTGEVRFYREIAPLPGVRVPACYTAEDTAGGTLLVLEDLSGWLRLARGAARPPCRRPWAARLFLNSRHWVRGVSVPHPCGWLAGGASHGRGGDSRTRSG